MKNEFKVGLLVFSAILFLFFLTTQVNSFKNMTKKGYTIYAMLDNAAGLEPNSKVKANGIDVGYIKDLTIDGDKIKAKIFINEGVKLPEDSRLMPMQESMLGGKYAGIHLGHATQFLQDQSQIQAVKGLASIDQASDSMAKAADEFRSFIADFHQVLDNRTRMDLKESFANINKVTADLREFTKLGRLNQAVDNFNQMAENLSQTSQKFSKTADLINGKLPHIMQDIATLVGDLRSTSKALRTKVPALADKYAAIAQELQTLLEQNRQPLNNSLQEAGHFFSKGKDAFEKVDTLLDAVDKIQLEVSMHGEAMAHDKYTKGYLSLNYKPSDTKSYRFSVVGMDDYSRLSDDGGVIEPKKHEDGKVLVSAQIAKRYDDVTLRAGLIESTVGAGVDYYLFDKQFKASAELFDMNAQNDVRGDKAHAKLSARYTLLKHLNIYGGYDNFLNPDAANAFIGLGVQFYDNDLKTLILSQGLSGLAK